MVTECLQRENHKTVVSDSSQAEPKTSAQLEAHVQAFQSMVAESSYRTSISVETLVRQYLRQEPSALVAHAGICAGGAGRPAFLPRPNSPNQIQRSLSAP